MTDNTMSVQALPGKSADADSLREMIGFAAPRLMDLEVGGLTGAVEIGCQSKEDNRDRVLRQTPITRREIVDVLAGRRISVNHRILNPRYTWCCFENSSTKRMRSHALRRQC